MAEQAEVAQQQAAAMAELMQEAKGLACLGPYEISDELRPKIDALDLWQNVAELRDQGYTVVKDVAPPELFDQLREVIHRFAEETEGNRKTFAASMLLGRDPVGGHRRDPAEDPRRRGGQRRPRHARRPVHRQHQARGRSAARSSCGSELAAGAVPGAQLRAYVLHAVRRHDGGRRRHPRRAGFGGVAALSYR